MYEVIDELPGHFLKHRQESRQSTKSTKGNVKRYKEINSICLFFTDYKPGQSAWLESVGKIYCLDGPNLFYKKCIQKGKFLPLSHFYERYAPYKR